MISNAFKSAYMQKENAFNAFGRDVGEATKNAFTVVAGAAGALGAFGDGAVASATKHNLAGKIGGIGGNIMLAYLDEKKDVSSNKAIQDLSKLSDEELDARFEKIASGTEAGSLEEKVVDTVWNKIEKERSRRMEEKVLKDLLRKENNNGTNN